MSFQKFFLIVKQILKAQIPESLTRWLSADVTLWHCSVQDHYFTAVSTTPVLTVMGKGATHSRRFFSISRLWDPAGFHFHFQSHPPVTHPDGFAKPYVFSSVCLTCPGDLFQQAGVLFVCEAFILHHAVWGIPLRTERPLTEFPSGE